MGLKAGISRINLARQWRSFGTESRTDEVHNKYALRGEYAPVYIVLGFVSVAVGLGMHTAKQQLVHSPGVHVSKKRRELFPEVEIPDSSTANGDNFIRKSFLRKVAHIQRTPASDPFTRSRHAETLKSVGVNARPRS